MRRVALGLLLLVVGCKAPATPPAPKVASPKPPAATPAPGNGVVIGTTPSNPLISDHGGGVVSNNGAGLSGSVRAPATLLSENGLGWRLLTTFTEAPVANAAVTLTDAGGKPVTDVAGKPITALTAADGTYKLAYAGGAANLLVKVSLRAGLGDLVGFVPKGATRADLDLTSTLTMGFILDQYVKGDDQVLARLPGDVEAATRATTRAALTNGAIAVPDALTATKVVAAVTSLRQADAALDAQLVKVKELLVVGSQTAAITDGAALAAQLNGPTGLAADAAGNVYITEHEGQLVRKLTRATGTLATVAGSGAYDHVDGLGPAAAFRSPYQAVVDGRGTLFVAEDSSALRQVAPDGRVTSILAGRFKTPGNLAIDGSGQVYVSDTLARRVYRFDAKNPEGTLAVASGPAGTVAPAANAPLPGAIAVDLSGNLYLVSVLGTAGRLLKLDAAGHETVLIPNGMEAVSSLAITPDGHTAYILAGSIEKIDLTAATPVRAPVVQGALDPRLRSPLGLALAPDGNLLLGLGQVNLVVALTPDGQTITPLAGNGKAARLDGGAAGALFDEPGALLPLPDGSFYVAEPSGALRLVKADQTVSTVLPSADAGWPTLGAATGLARDAAGSVYIADHLGILKLAGGKVTRFAGSAAAPLIGTAGIAFDAAGNLVVAGTDVVRKVDTAGVVTLVAGLPDTPGLVDGPGPSARFKFITDVATDPLGNVFLADASNHVIRRVDAAGVVSTLAGSGAKVDADGVGVKASFTAPAGLAYDPVGHALYVVDDRSNALRRIDVRDLANPVVTTISVPTPLLRPTHVAYDARGYLLVADADHRQVRQLALP
ncbi:MAG: hypothetical protein JWM80_1841 [Cyanobacteria bacterium RYN_339]|nr:hypothetical protein [Cyanobacteria bacterium RYN_339]